MLIYSRASKASVDRAVAKAKQIKPRARVMGYGRFLVAGSKGERYTVTFGADSQGELVVDCNCTAGKNGRVCYHASSVSALYKGQWTERRQQMAKVQAALAKGNKAAMTDREFDAVLAEQEAEQQAEYDAMTDEERAAYDAEQDRLEWEYSDFQDSRY